MIDIKLIGVSGLEGAIRSMRNPLNSWDKSDSYACDTQNCANCVDAYRCDGTQFHIGKNDMGLCKKLIKAGPDHRKFLRMIHAQFDVTAPVFFLSEFDTYKIATVRNSCSFMHKGLAKPFKINDFSVQKEIYEILTPKAQNSKLETILYPYETDEYKLYVCENGREYEVYKNGRIFSKEFTYTDNYGTGRTRHFERKEVSPSLTKFGYWELRIGGRNGERWMLHRLVAFCWCENPNKFETVDHLDGNKNNNSMENLEWVSRETNIIRGFSSGLMRHDDIRADYINWKCSSKILPDEKITIRQKYKEGKTQNELAKEYNISQPQISVICREALSTSNKKDLFEYCWAWEQTLKTLNELRDLYIETKDISYFRQIRELLPMGYLYKSTVDMNYETLMNIYNQRKNHKLDEWRDFCSWIETFPYMRNFLDLG